MCRELKIQERTILYDVIVINFITRTVHIDTKFTKKNLIKDLKSSQFSMQSRDKVYCTDNKKKP